MSWFRKSKQAIVVDEVTAEMKAVAEKRKSAIETLISTLRAIPLDAAIVDLGSDLTNVKRNGQ